MVLLIQFGYGSFTIHNYVIFVHKFLPMKKRGWLFMSIMGIIVCSFVSDNLPKDFKAVLERAHLSFEAPSGYASTKVIANDQVAYDYALKLKDPDKKFEVSYLIMPLDSMLIEYKESLKDTSKTMIDPNTLYEKMMLVIALNAGGGTMPADGNMPEIQPFDSAAVKNEFNADWGGAVFITLGKEFGQNYTACMIVGIHKNNVADAYYFYLAEEKSDIPDLMKGPFHSLKFK